MVDLIIFETINLKAVGFTWRLEISWKFHIIKNDGGLGKFLNAKVFARNELSIYQRIYLQCMNL